MHNSTYVKIGAFVVFALTGAIVACIVLGAGAFRHKAGLLAETYFEGSVQGVSEGSPVKYRGIPVGTVKRVSFAWADYRPEEPSKEALRAMRYARVVFEFNRDMMLNADTVESPDLLEQQIQAGLRVLTKPQGITGITYLDLDYLPNAPEMLPVPWTPAHPYVPSAPGLGETFMDIVRDMSGQVGKLGGLADKVSGVLEQSGELLQESRPVLLETLENLRISSGLLTDSLREFQERPIGFLRGQPRDEE